MPISSNLHSTLQPVRCWLKNSREVTALKQAGLYAGEPDGDFGARSAEAVAEFQKRNVGAMYVDAVVGPQTGTALLKNSESWPSL